jgi:hypothetical protein
MMGTPNNHFHNKNMSPNQGTLEQLSNNSISPNTDLKSGSRLADHQQIIIGADGEKGIAIVKHTPNRDSQMGSSTFIDGSIKTPGISNFNGSVANKTPIQIYRLPNG